jgi:hypothetical protein
VARRGVIRFPGESVGNESEYSRQQNSLWRVVANSSAMHNADCSATLVLLVFVKSIFASCALLSSFMPRMLVVNI